MIGPTGWALIAYAVGIVCPNRVAILGVSRSNLTKSEIGDGSDGYFPSITHLSLRYLACCQL